MSKSVFYNAGKKQSESQYSSSPYEAGQQARVEARQQEYNKFLKDYSDYTSRSTKVFKDYNNRFGSKDYNKISQNSAEAYSVAKQDIDFMKSRASEISHFLYKNRDTIGKKGNNIERQLGELNNQINFIESAYKDSADYWSQFKDDASRENAIYGATMSDKYGKKSSKEYNELYKKFKVKETPKETVETKKSNSPNIMGMNGLDDSAMETTSSPNASQKEKYWLRSMAVQTASKKEINDRLKDLKGKIDKDKDTKDEITLYENRLKQIQQEEYAKSELTLAENAIKHKDEWKDPSTLESIGNFGEVIKDNPVSSFLAPTSNMMFDKNRLAIYNWIKENEGEDKAEKYLEVALSNYTKETNNTIQRAIEYEYGNHDNLFGDISYTLGSMATNIFAAPMAAIEDTANFVRDGKVSSSGLANSVMRAGNVMQNEVTKDFSDVGQFLYGAGKSTVESAVNTALFGPTSRFLMGQAAGAQKLQEMSEKGEDPEKALLTSIAVGVAEAAFEKYSIEGMLKIKNPSSIKGFILDTLKQAGVEASEEGFTDIANYISDAIINGNNSEYQQNIRNYIENGYSEADANKKAFTDAVGQVAEDMAAGALSGGLHSAVQNTIVASNNAKQGNRIIKNGNVDTALELANSLDEEYAPESRRISAEIQTQIDNGKNPSKMGLGALQSAVVRESQYQAPTEANIFNRLTQKGVDNETAKKETPRIAKLFEKGTMKNLDQLVENDSMADALSEIIAEEEERGFKQSEVAMQMLYLGMSNNDSTDNSGNDTNEGNLSDEIEKAIYNDSAVSNDGNVTLDNGESVKILGQSDGGIEVETSEGNKIVNFDEVRFANKVQSVVAESFDVAERAGLPSQYFGEVVNSVKDNQNPSDYMKYFARAYEYGLVNMPKTSLFTDFGGGRVLDYNQALLAYNLGQNDYRAKLGDLKSTETKTDGKVTFGKNASVKDIKKATQTSAYKTMKILSKARGINFVIENNPKSGTNGWFDANDNSIHIDIHAGLSGNDTMLFTMSHELVHWMMTNNAKQFYDMRDYLVKTYAKNGVSLQALINRQLSALKNNENLKGLSARELRDIAMEEVVAESCETMLRDSNAIAKLANENKSWVEKFLGKLKELISSIRDAYGKLNPETAEGKLLSEIKGGIEGLAKIYENGLTFVSEGVEVSKDNVIKLQLKQYNTTGRNTLNEYLTERYGDQNASDLMETIDQIASVMQNIKDDNPNLEIFGHWQDTEVELDDKGRPIFTTSIKNSEYELNQDFSRVCKKRRQLDYVLNMLSKDPEFRAEYLEKSDFVAINKAIKKHGFEIACALCFVDAKRFRQSEWAEDFSKVYNGILNSVKVGTATPFNFATENVDVREGVKINVNNKITYEKKDSKGKPATFTFKNLDDLISTCKNSNIVNMAKLIRDDPTMRHEMRPADIISSRGFDSAQRVAPILRGIMDGWGGSSVPKPSSSDTIYDNSVLTNDIYTEEAARAMGGARMNSFSDFMAHMFFDYCQAFADLSAKGLPMQSYTKELAFARIFGLTRGKINMSGIAAIREDAPTNATAKQTEQEKLFAGLDVSKICEELHKDTSELTEEDINGMLDLAEYVWADESIDMEKAILLQTGILYDKLSEADQKECYELIKGGKIQEALSKAGNNVNTEYAKHIGTIVVGVSDAHIRKLLRDPTVRMVIPYHKSGINNLVAKEMRIAFFNDYTSVQHTGFVVKGKRRGNLTSSTNKDITKKYAEGAKEAAPIADFDFYRYWNKTVDGVFYDGRKTAEKYLDWCANGEYDADIGKNIYRTTNGGYVLAERIHKIGEIVPMFDAFTNEENYYKVLEDFDVYDTITEEHSPQEAVQFLGKVENGQPAHLPADYKEVLMRELEAEQSNADRFKDEYNNNGLRDEILAIVKKRGYVPSDVFTNNKAEGLNIPVKDYSIIRDQKKAVMTDERIEDLIEDSTGGMRKDYARSWITSINPKDFLNMTLGKENQDRNKFDDMPGDYGTTVNNYDFIEGGLKKQKRQTPYLSINIENGKVMGHEGRHRLRALEKEGITSVEIRVEFVDSTGRVTPELYGMGNALGRIDSLLVYNQFGTKQSAVIENLLPLNNSFREEILSEYGENANDANIRYQQKLQDVDSNGKKLSEWQKTFFANSVVRDSNGRLLRVYHNTDSDFNVFDTSKQGSKNGLNLGKGFYFTPHKQIAESYGGKITKEYYLNVEKLFDSTNVNSDEFVGLLKNSNLVFNETDVRRAIAKRFTISFVLANYVDGFSNRNANDKFNEILAGNGYDGIVNGIVGTNEDYVIFDSAKAKLTTNENPTESKDIRYQFKGINKYGIEVYETSEEVMEMPMPQRISKVRRDIQGQFAGKKARFERNGHTFFASVDKRIASEILYGGNQIGTSAKGKKAVVRLFADGDIFDLVEGSRYGKSLTDLKNHKSRDGFTDYFDYLYKTVQIDGSVYDIIVNVKKKIGVKDGFTYTVSVYDNKKQETSPAKTDKSGSSNLQEMSLANNSIQQDTQKSQEEIFSVRNQVRSYNYGTVNGIDINKELEEENKHLKKIVENLKELNKSMRTITHGEMFTKTSLNLIASDIMHTAGLKQGKAEIANLVSKVYQDFKRTNDSNKFIKDSRIVAREILSNRKVDSANIQIANELRNKPISLNADEIAEVEKLYGSMDVFKEEMLGRVNIADNGTSLEDRFKELSKVSNKFADADSNDLVGTLSDIVDEIYSSNDVERYYNNEEEVLRVSESVIDNYFRGSTLRTFADVRQDEINALKKKHQEQMKELRADRDERIAKIRKAYQESRKKNVEGRRKTEMKNRIVRRIKKLNAVLFRGTKENNVKIPIQPLVRQALEAAETALFGENGEDIGKYFDAVSNMYNGLRGDAQYGDVYSDDIAKRLASVSATIAGKTYQDMTSGDLNEIRKALQIVQTVVYRSNKIFRLGKFWMLNDYSRNVIDELSTNMKKEKSLYGSAHIMANRYSWDMLKPVYAFERMNSKELQGLFNDLVKGEGVSARDIDEAKNKIAELREKYNWKNWHNNKVTLEFVDGTSKEIDLQKLLSIYAYSKRKQADAHMEEGGFVIDYEKNNLGMMIQRNEIKPYRLNQMDVVNALAKLTDEQAKYVDEMQRYLSKDMADKGNESARQLYGINLFNEEYYFPLKSSKDYVSSTTEPTPSATLKNSGMTKATVPNANNPIILEDFDSVWANHVQKMSAYHGLVIPIDNMSKVLNWKKSDKIDGYSSVKSAMNAMFGRNAYEYVNKLLVDLNGGGNASDMGYTGGLFSKFKKGAVLASMSVNIQQPTAILRATSIVPAIDFVKVPNVSPKQHMKTWEDLKKYSAIAVIKEMGGIDVGSARSTEQYIDDNPNLLGKIDNAASFLAEHGDIVGWNMIWRACQHNIERTTNLRGEEAKRKAAELFDKAVVYTQVYDSVTSRSGLMRSKNEITKFATAFKGEPTVSMNILFDTIVKMKRREIPIAQASRNIASVVASQVAASFAASLVYGARKRKEDESYLNAVAYQFAGKLIDEMNPLNLFPYISDVVSIFQGFSSKRPDMDVIEGLIDSGRDVFDFIVDGKGDAEEVIESFAGQLANCFGIPVKNLIRDCKAFYNLLQTTWTETEDTDVVQSFVDGLKN